MANPIWSYWATYFRNARALGAAVSIFIAIGAMSLLRCNPMIDKVNTSGVVTAIEAEGLHPFNDGEAQSRVLIMTADSTKVRLLLPPPIPAVGSVIPIVVEKYKKGDSRYYLDLLKWRMDGPG